MNKSLWTGIGASVAMFILIIDGKTALEGAAQGIDLCIKTVVPSLFPFFVLSILLTGSFAGSEIRCLRPIAKLFHIPRGYESILIPAFLGGYPAGAHSVKEAYIGGSLSRENAERMLCFCNNAGPSFLFGMVGSLFPEKWMVWALWMIHIFSAWISSQLFPAYAESASSMKRKKNGSVSDVMVAAIQMMAQVCGWVILFRIVIRFLSRWILWLFPTPVQILISGFLELSNGCWELRQLENVSLRFFLCSAMLAFGGICVTMQTMSAAKGLSLRYYLYGKLIQTASSLIFAAIVIWRIWIALPVIILVLLLFPQKMKNSSRNPVGVRV